MRRLCVAVGVGCAVVLTACGHQGISGMGLPTSDVPGSVAPSAAVSSAEASGVMATIDPCHLITTEEGAQYGITGVNVRNSPGARGCDYKTSTPGELLGIDLRDSQGLDQFDTSLGAAKSTTVAGRQAKEQQSETGECVIAVAITSASRVDVSFGLPSQDTAKACQTDEQIAALIAGKITG